MLVSCFLFFHVCAGCDPAPFYLFDELDQALDSTYRKAVANVIQKQANSKETPTQFIVSTFRQELVAVANSCYGISHQNKVSNIHHMSKRDAEKFIADLMTEEEAVGEVKSITGASRSTLSSRKRKSSVRDAATPQHDKTGEELADDDDEVVADDDAPDGESATSE